ncbi:MAG: UDP-N-acetylmuramoyl-tripeptide--D-alanyl-D-alanine ligase [Bacteroidota bacterium]
MDIQELYQIYLKHPFVCTDSRDVPIESLFFALKGDRFDGNKYAEAALKSGAAYAVIDNPEYKKGEQYILVEDSLVYLQQLAHHHRNQFKIPVIGITGSNGKTTTKELMTSVLTSSYPTHATKGNFNNHIGVPLTLLAMPLDTEVAIIEMGMNHLGEIAELCKIANPTHGLITNIGKAHLEGVGSLEGVKKAKSELYDYLKAHNGLIFVNRDERFLWELVGSNHRKKLSYSQTEELAEHYIYQVELLDSKVFVNARFKNDSGQSININSQLIGTYNFNNMMTAIVIGQYFKVSPLKIKAAIENYIPSNNRSQVVQQGSNTFILDAYNANPTSMQNALEYFKTYPAKKKIAILGDMLELGEESSREHQTIINQAEKSDLQQVILVGECFGQCNFNGLYFKSINELKTWYDQQKFEQTAFLIKGSRGIRLEQLLKE